jgi:hypothetical protein
MDFSSILLRQDKRLMGLKLEGSEWFFPGFGIGITLANFHLLRK